MDGMMQQAVDAKLAGEESVIQDIINCIWRRGSMIKPQKLIWIASTSAMPEPERTLSNTGPHEEE